MQTYSVIVHKGIEYSIFGATFYKDCVVVEWCEETVTIPNGEWTIIQKVIEVSPLTLEEFNDKIEKDHLLIQEAYSIAVKEFGEQAPIHPFNDKLSYEISFPRSLDLADVRSGKIEAPEWFDLEADREYLIKIKDYNFRFGEFYYKILEKLKSNQ